MLKKMILVTLVILVGVYGYLAFVGVEPKDRRPGTRLAGTEVSLPNDISDIVLPDEVHVETHPWYGIPFSVTTVIVAHEGHFYVPSLYDSPQVFPGTKYWNHVVERNPNVRLRINDQIYDLKIEPVLDREAFEGVYGAFVQKYPFWRESITLGEQTPRFALLKLSA